MNVPDASEMPGAVQLQLPWQHLCCCHFLIGRIGHDSQELDAAPPYGVVWHTCINVVIDIIMVNRVTIIYSIKSITYDVIISNIGCVLW